MASSLGEVIERQRDAIVGRFVDEVRKAGLPPRPLTRLELMNELHAYLSEMTAALANDARGDDDAGVTARRHGSQRWHVGYDLRSIIEEYAILQRIILSQIEIEPYEPTLREIADFAAFVGRGVSQAVVEFVDKSEREIARQQERLAFLARAGVFLASSLELDETLRNVARASVPTVADWCAIDLCEGSAIRRVAIADVNDATTELVVATDATLRPREDRGEVSTALVTKQSELVPEVPDPSGASDRFALIRSLGLKSFMAVPLLSGDSVIGAVSFGASTSLRSFDSGDLALAEELARRAAFAIDHARLYRAAQEARRGREEVLAIVSHDLRNPLTTIAMTTARLATSTLPLDAGERFRDLFARLQRASQRMQRIVNDLVDISAVGARTLSLEVERQRLGEVVGEAVDALRPSAEGEGVELVAEPIDVDIRCDRGRVLQVLGNLVSNAIRHTPVGGKVVVSVDADDEAARIEVRDEGAGIAPERLAHLFERFWEGREQRRGSLGLGLAIARGIVEAHGGRIWAESEPGHGSTFFFTLPRAPSENDEHDAPDRPSAPDRSKHSVRKKRRAGGHEKRAGHAEPPRTLPEEPRKNLGK